MTEKLIPNLDAEQEFEDGLENFPKVSYSRISSDLNNEFDSLKGGYDTAKTERINHYNEYAFRKYSNDVQGKSSFVDTTIFNVVQWMKPNVIKPYVETDSVVELTPESEEDLVPSLAMKEILTYQIRKKMDYFSLLSNSIEGSLVFGYSFAKVVW